MADPSFLNPISVRASIGSVAIDITQKVTENYPNIVTDNPVENGSPTTDHITSLPPRIQIQGGFTDIRVTNLVGAILQQDSIRNRAKNEFDKLLKLNLSRETFTVMDGLHLFRNMVFENLQLMKEREGFTVYFQAELKGINIINLSPQTSRLSNRGDALVRSKVANASLLSIGSTVSNESLLFESIGVLL